MVMISMTSSTSITSISGVVLMSIITSGSLERRDPTFIAMCVFLLQCIAPACRGGGSVMNPTLAMPARWQA